MDEIIKSFFSELEKVWMGEIKNKQREYNKSRCLNPNNGDDWRREIL